MVRLAWTDFKCPVADWKSDMVQPVDVESAAMRTSQRNDVPGGSNFGKIALSNPSVPVVHEFVLGNCATLKLSERPLVDDFWIASALKQTRRDPRLTR